MIDDARLFLCAPPGERVAGQWPDFDSVLHALKELSPDHSLAVVNDTIVLYSMRIKPEFTVFCQQHGRDILSAWDKSRSYDQVLEQLKEKEGLILLQADHLAEKDAVIKTMVREIGKKEACIRGQDRQLKEKEACIQGQGQQLKEKEALIRVLADRSRGELPDGK